MLRFKKGDRVMVTDPPAWSRHYLGTIGECYIPQDPRGWDYHIIFDDQSEYSFKAKSVKPIDWEVINKESEIYGVLQPEPTEVKKRKFQCSLCNSKISNKKQKMTNTYVDIEDLEVKLTARLEERLCTVQQECVNKVLDILEGSSASTAISIEETKPPNGNEVESMIMMGLADELALSGIEVMDINPENIVPIACKHIAEIRETLDKAVTRCEYLDECMKTTETTSAEKDVSISELNARVTSLRQEVGQALTAKNKFKADVERVTEELHTEKQNSILVKDTLKKELDAIRSNFHKALTWKEQYKSEVTRVTKIAEETQNMLQSLNGQYEAEKQKNQHNHSVENEQLKVALRTKTSEHAELAIKFEELSAKYDLMDKENQVMMNAIRDARSMLSK